MSDFPEEYTDGSVLFCGQRFNVDPRALIPRFETEELVKYCVKLLREKPEIGTIADIGTGTGIIPISIAHKTDRELDVFATDLSPDALDLARENAGKFSGKAPLSRGVAQSAGGFDNLFNPPALQASPLDRGAWQPIHFLQGNLLEPLIQHFGKNPPESILITANLPYVREVEVDHTLIHEPRMAFVGGGRTGFVLYEDFFKQLRNWKDRPRECHVVIEFGLWQRDIAETVISSYGWESKFFADLRGIERFAHICLSS